MALDMSLKSRLLVLPWMPSWEDCISADSHGLGTSIKRPRAEDQAPGQRGSGSLGCASWHICFLCPLVSSLATFSQGAHYVPQH